MKGLFARAPGQLDILDLPRPEPGSYEAVVRTEACAICNSTDTKLLHGQFFAGTWPLLLGHESVGRIVEIGEGVRNYALGDRVLRGRLDDRHVPYPGGRSCWGGFAEYTVVTDVWARDGADYNAWPHAQQVVPAEIAPADATLLIMLKEDLNAITSMDVPGRSVAIVGTGPVAEAMTVFARLLGARTVTVWGRSDRRADRFRSLGVDAYVVGTTRPQAVSAIMARGGFERVIEAVGSSEVLALCLNLAAPDGSIGLYGIPPENAPYAEGQTADPRVFWLRVNEAAVHDQILQWVAEGTVRLSDWVGHTLPWQDYQRGFELIWSKQASKVVLTFPSSADA
jgi:threonine dehydrogenase-like Zn-dependent dehydrogenase